MPLVAVEATIVSMADSRLPMSLSMVVSDLEVEGCMETICWITSRAVSRERWVEFLEKLIDSGDIFFYFDEMDLARGEGPFDRQVLSHGKDAFTMKDKTESVLDYGSR